MQTLVPSPEPGRRGVLLALLALAASQVSPGQTKALTAGSIDLLNFSLTLTHGPRSITYTGEDIWRMLVPIQYEPLPK